MFAHAVTVRSQPFQRRPPRPRGSVTIRRADPLASRDAMLLGVLGCARGAVKAKSASEVVQRPCSCP